MFGSAFIIHPNGWLCSNEATMNVERDLFTDTDGKEKMKHTNILKVKYCFDGIGEIQKDMDIECVFKLDGSDKMQGFIGKIQRVTKEGISVSDLVKTDRIAQILNKIKEEI